jgi:hypothetical protein
MDGMTSSRIRIIAQREHRQWSAWFVDAPEAPYAGTSPRHAIERLLAAHPERHLTLDALVPEAGWERGRQLRFLAPSRRTCPDCGGSGLYVGLQAVETCRMCGGQKTVDC